MPSAAELNASEELLHLIRTHPLSPNIRGVVKAMPSTPAADLFELIKLAGFALAGKTA